MIYRKHIPNKIYFTFLNDFDDLDRLRVDATEQSMLIVSVVPFVVVVCVTLSLPSTVWCISLLSKVIFLS